MYTAFRDIASAISWETLLEREAVICGSPDYVVEKLAEFQKSFGFTDLLCWTRLGGLDHRKVLRSMELMHDKVIPHLRDSQPPGPPLSHANA
jgi:alkanesulfonate monooxygenase SsuD/methylene tetrahydromethanopterin reductase-like flavin-dependent oxidoreductase (luciferase family)